MLNGIKNVEFISEEDISFEYRFIGDINTTLFSRRVEEFIGKSGIETVPISVENYLYDEDKKVYKVLILISSYKSLSKKEIDDMYNGIEIINKEILLWKNYILNKQVQVCLCFLSVI